MRAAVSSLTRRVVLVELCQVTLLHGDCLVQGADLRLELLGLLLMPALILIPLLFDRFTIMLQRLPAVEVLFLEGFDMGLLCVEHRRHAGVALTRLVEQFI